MPTDGLDAHTHPRKRARMRIVAVLVLSAALVLVGPASWAYNCPVVIKQA